MAEPVTVEIFIIGNEILIGDIQDTNTNWLCKEINSLGGHVVRATVLRDELEVIAVEIQAALLRGARVIFTSGGLGPTADDLTLTAVAKGVGVEVMLHEKALQMVKESYDTLFARGIMAQGGLNPAREKMAWLPEGSIPLDNPVGTAPGVLLQTGQTTIISLPGVPSELKGIFNSSLQPFLQKTFKGGISAMHTITVRCNDESVMEPVLSRVVPAHPGCLHQVPGQNPGRDTGTGYFPHSGRIRPGNSLETLIAWAVQDLKDGLDVTSVLPIGTRCSNNAFLCN